MRVDAIEETTRRHLEIEERRREIQQRNVEGFKESLETINCIGELLINHLLFVLIVNIIDKLANFQEKYHKASKELKYF